MPEEPRLQVTLQDGVKRITFNAPERRNAVDRATSERLLEVVQETARDESRVVILTGAGDAFCAGADLSTSKPGGGNVTDFLRRVVNPTILALREMPKPVIARVHGHAVGVGCNYALAADIRIASTDAKFGQVFSKIGLIPDGGSTYFLPRMIGYPKAFEWMITGAIIDARQAFAGIKRALTYGESHPLAEALDFEAVTQKTCYESADFREGVQAFQEK